MRCYAPNYLYTDGGVEQTTTYNNPLRMFSTDLHTQKFVGLYQHVTWKLVTISETDGTLIKLLLLVSLRELTAYI